MMERDHDMSQSPAVSVKKAGDTKMGRGCAIIFFGLFFLAGLAACTFTVVVPVYNALDAMDWQESPCTITSSTVKTHQDSDGSTYSIEIKYRYEFNNIQYTGDRYDFSLGSSSGYKGKKAVVDRYPVNMQTTCFVDPVDPSQAVISRNIPMTILFGLISLPFLLVGGGGLLGTFGFFKSSKRPGESFEWKSDKTITGARGGNEYGDFRSHDFAPVGPITLKPASSPLGTFVVSVLVTLFWNGIVSVFVVGFFGGMFNGGFKFFDVCLGLFLTPFVLVGIAMIFWVGHSFLSLFNPRPTLTVSNASAAIGETIHVTWSFRGNTRSVRRLHIFLHGQESATYRRGTDTTTDHETFAKLALVDTTNFMDIANGQGELRIPIDTMHSFEFGNNKITWTIEVSGEIAWWPDVKASFPYKIAPMPRGAKKL